MVMKGIFPRQEEILRYLKSRGPATSRTLAKHFGIGLRGVQDAIKQLRDLKTAIYICEWKRYSLNGDLSPVYAVKEYPLQRDIPKPPALTNTEKCRRYQQAKKGKVKNSWINSIFNVSAQTSRAPNEMQ